MPTEPVDPAADATDANHATSADPAAVSRESDADADVDAAADPATDAAAVSRERGPDADPATAADPATDATDAAAVSREGGTDPGRGRLWAWLVGWVAGTVTLGSAEALAGITQRTGWAGGTPSPVLALGGAFIDRTPPWLKRLAIQLFDTNDKLALLIGMGIVIFAVTGFSGWLAAKNRRAGLVTVVAISALAGLAIGSRPNASAVDQIPLLVGTFLGLVCLSKLLDRLGQWRTAVSQAEVPLARRSFLGGMAGAGLLAVIGAGAAAALAQGVRAVQAGRASLRLPSPGGVRVSPAELVSITKPGLSPLITPLEDFYRIDTALATPQILPEKWSLRIHGLVENELRIDFAELLALPMVERMITLSCVSNEIGGDLVGNQVWLGHPIRELLARAKPLKDADMVLSMSADGWTAGTPLDALTDPNRDALLAVGMGGEPLPVNHGFPARLVVPGLYGFVSATKWVVDLEVTRFDRAQGYWTPRGWSAKGPIKTQSRIDIPRSLSTVKSGNVPVAGVAWAPHTGLTKIEIQVDGGPWQAATLGEGGSQDSWRQWSWQWSATSGEHELKVRATDASGYVQPETRTDVAPDGATGWHTIRVTVR